MKIKPFLAVLLILSLAIFMNGCDKNNDKAVNEFNALVEYLEGTDGGYMNNMGAWILGEANINTSDYLVLDLRSAADYNNTPNPIDGAINTTLEGMWTHAETATKPILVTCYSGQTAAFAHMLLRLKGYEAYSMKFGMSMHDQSLDKWTGNCSNQYATDTDWVTTASSVLPSFDYPELNTGEEIGAAILDERIEVAIAAWPTLITAADVMSNISAFNIINYWSTSDYLGYGHINGAYQVSPGTLTTAENLSVFDPVGANIFYCYTGQTAAAACAYLTVLGYDVKSIKFGTNAMIWDEMTGHKWSKPY